MQSWSEEGNTTAKQVQDCKRLKLKWNLFLSSTPTTFTAKLHRALEPRDDTQCLQGSRMSVSDLIWVPSPVPTVKSGSARNV